jgi:peptidoglycan/xylan/chitin deacetylase (PgdA/CDA1 family)
MEGISSNIKAIQFHRITSSFQLCGTWNTPMQFERFLQLIQDKDIKTILPGEASNGIIITFDDGERTVYSNAFPLLKKYGMKAVVFVIVDYIGRKNYWDISLTGQRTEHLTWKEIEEMQDYGIEFGSHTMSHSNLLGLNSERLEYELAESRRILAKRLGKCVSISYPFNRVNRTIAYHAAHVGYQYGFGGDGSNVLLIKKEAVYITDTPDTLKVKLYENPGVVYRYERVKQSVINYFTLATMVVKSFQGSA